MSDGLARRNVKVVLSSETSEVFGLVKSNLMKAGAPIPINDVWIASHGLETGSVVITYDKHSKNSRVASVGNELTPSLIKPFDRLAMSIWVHL